MKDVVFIRIGDYVFNVACIIWVRGEDDGKTYIGLTDGTISELSESLEVVWERIRLAVIS